MTREARKRDWAVAAAGLVLMLCGPALVEASSIYEDFNDGNADGWTFNWSPGPAGSISFPEYADRGHVLRIEKSSPRQGLDLRKDLFSFDTSNYTIEFDFRVLNPDAGVEKSLSVYERYDDNNWAYDGFRYGAYYNDWLTRNMVDGDLSGPFGSGHHPGPGGWTIPPAPYPHQGEPGVSTMDDGMALWTRYRVIHSSDANGTTSQMFFSNDGGGTWTEVFTWHHPNGVMPLGASFILSMAVSADYEFDNVLVIDGVDWRNVTPNPPGPSPRHPGAMAYDPARDRTVLFTGYWGHLPWYNDTWEWNGATKTWTDVTPPSGSSPSARIGCGMVYYPPVGEIVMFGGGYGDPWTELYFNELWTWNGTGWSQIGPDAGSSAPWPPARADAAMVYDSSRGVLVLFGGYRDNGATLLNDTWELRYDGINWAWEEKCVGCLDRPAARQGHAMAYDEQRGLSVLFGGLNGQPGDWHNFSDTWTWNGTTWTCVAVDGDPLSPSPRLSHEMTYDVARQVVVLFGGMHYPSLPVDDAVWEWDGLRWVSRRSSLNPSPRTSFGLVYDSSRHVCVLFGGDDGSNPGLLNDTWEYGLLEDCNGNGVPDAQDIASGASQDCNGNGVPDECDIADGTSQDCNDNGIPDECEVPPLNTIPTGSPLEVISIPVADVNGTDSSVVLQQGVTYWLLAEGVWHAGYGGQSEDAEWWTQPPTYPEWTEDNDWSGYPPDSMDLIVDDALQPDWWGSSLTDPSPVSDFATFGVHIFSPSHAYWMPVIGDGTTINLRVVDHPSHYHDNWGTITVAIYAATGPATDCNHNGIPDECDIASGTSHDCNANGVPDECDVADDTSKDCDGNGTPDECQPDSDGDGWIDVCDNCPTVFNPSQINSDTDPLGDACDNCPGVSNPGQEDCDSDGYGNACGGVRPPRGDMNGDGVIDGRDVQLFVEALLGQ
jgi:hypothetical protein